MPALVRAQLPLTLSLRSHMTLVWAKIDSLRCFHRKLPVSKFLEIATQVQNRNRNSCSLCHRPERPIKYDLPPSLFFSHLSFFFPCRPLTFTPTGVAIQLSSFSPLFLTIYLAIYLCHLCGHFFSLYSRHDWLAPLRGVSDQYLLFGWEAKTSHLFPLSLAIYLAIYSAIHVVIWCRYIDRHEYGSHLYAVCRISSPWGWS